MPTTPEPLPPDPYRAPEPASPDPYLAAWSVYRYRRRRVWLVILALSFAFGFILALFPAIPGVSGLVAFFVLLVGLITVNCYARFACPRCGKQFHRRGSAKNPLSRHCLHCGIKIGTPNRACHPDELVRTAFMQPMTDRAGIEGLQDAIRRLHGAGSRHIETVPVREEVRGKPAFEREVEVFELVGHPVATRAYAWWEPTTRAERRVFAVLHEPPLDSPIAAVRASIPYGLDVPQVVAQLPSCEGG